MLHSFCGVSKRMCKLTDIAFNCPTLPHQEYANDFSGYVASPTILKDKDKLQALLQHFKPDSTYKFPVHDECGKKSSFQTCWLKGSSWLVYSPSMDGGYSKACALFGSETGYNIMLGLINL